MPNNFKVIGVTLPDFFIGEEKIINRILQNKEVDFVHIRKPGSSYKETENLLKRIKMEYHPLLKLHDHFDLLSSYNLGGCHLNSRNPLPHPYAKSISKSIHSLIEIDEVKEFDYYFISPIFDSISKKGYEGGFDFSKLSSKISGTKAIALGGVTPDKFPFLISLGFEGAALSGYFFLK